MDNSDEKVTWILIPLWRTDVDKITMWLYHVDRTANETKDLKETCEIIIKSQLEKHGLTYRTEELGEISLDTLIFKSYPDSIAIQEQHFINPPIGHARICDYVHTVQKSQTI